MKSFLLQFAPIKEEFLFGHIFREAEVGHFAGGAYLSFVAQRSLYEGEIALHFLDVSPDFEYDVFSNGNGITITHGKVGGLSGGLQFPVYQPTSNFIHQRGLDTSMEGVQPTLEIGMWLPQTNDVVTVFVKFHLQSERIARTTSEAVIALLFQT